MTLKYLCDKYFERIFPSFPFVFCMVMEIMECLFDSSFSKTIIVVKPHIITTNSNSKSFGEG